MNTYKITNVTDKFGKRDIGYNSTLEIEYVDNMMKKIVNIKPNETIYLTTKTIPLSVNRLKIKNMVTVIEIPEKEVNKIIKSRQSKSNGIEILTEETKKEEQTQHQVIKKRGNKKEDDIDV